MALFTNLALQSKQSDGAQTTSKSLELPTVVQLFTDNPIPLTLDTALHHQQQQSPGPTSQLSSSHGGIYYSTPPSYATLHYTAVHCQNSAQMILIQDQQRGLRHLAKKPVTVVTPDLGVWNFRVSNRGTNKNIKAETSITETKITSTTSAVDTLLDSISSKSNSAASLAFCMVVDLSVLENVEPSITKMQEALVRYLINRESDKTDQETKDSVQTTTLYKLKKIQFGIGREDTKSIEAMNKTEPDESDKYKAIALQICVKLPENASDFQEYRDQQAISLLMYHLRRYAADLSASLVFVSAGIQGTFSSNDGKSSDIPLSPSPNQNKEGAESTKVFLLKEQPSVPVHLLPVVWREWALGKQVWKPDECLELYTELDINVGTKAQSGASANETDEGADVSAYSLIYGPGTQNEELIESVLLRNAHYPGHWDAAKESVWTILPKESATLSAAPSTANKKSASKIKVGDDFWLSELRESIAIPDSVKTPPPKKAAEAAASTTKTPNDAAVSSFFEDLLK